MEIGPRDSLLVGAVRMAEQTKRSDHRRGKHLMLLRPIGGKQGHKVVLVSDTPERPVQRFVVRALGCKVRIVMILVSHVRKW